MKALLALCVSAVVLVGANLAAGAIIIEPDNYADRTVLNTIIPQVTLSVARDDNSYLSFDVTATVDGQDKAPTGEMVFAHSNVYFWNSTRRMKMAFHVPVTSVSLDFGGASVFTPYIGRMDVFDSAGNVLDSYHTAPLLAQQFETMTLSRSQGDIAYAIAYIAPGEGDFGRLDHLVFVPEPATLTLLALGACLPFCRRRSRQGLAMIRCGRSRSGNARVIRGILIATSAAVLGKAPTLMAEQGFSPYVSHTAGTSTYGIVSGDFNQDGLDDLGTANEFGMLNYGSYAGSISVFYSGGTTFLPQQEYRVNNGVGYQCTSWIDAGDLDGDGRLDLVVANYHNTVAAFYGRQDGTFGDQQFYSAPHGTQRVTLADFNQDGRLDIASASVYTPSARVYYGLPAGGFGQVQDHAVNEDGHYILSADLNDDGRVDLATAAFSGLMSVSILYGNAGGFDPHATFTVADGPYALGAADLNADGHTDLLVVCRGANTVRVFHGTGNGFTLAADYAVGAGPFDLALADFDLDGRLDLATSNYSANSVTVLYGTDGGFGDRVDLPVATQPRGIAVGDFDGNGGLDLAVACYEANKISVLYNTIPEPASLSLLALSGLAMLNCRRKS